MKLKQTFLFSLFLVFFYACKLADVRPTFLKEQEITATNEEEGRDLLSASIQAMGYENLSEIDTYEAKALFKWKFPWSIMPINSLPGSKGNQVQFRFKPNSFDGQVEYLEGSRKGNLYGLQSWQAYKKKANGTIDYTKDKKREWALAAFHYLMEGPWRLLKADIITYAGTTQLDGQDYDLVFASWQSPEPHKEHDQWLLYINQKTKFVDLANITIRDFFMPFPPKLAEGSVRYLKRTQTSEGVYFPTELVIQLMAPKKEKKHVYRISFEDFKFDSFPEEDLRPFKSLKDFGDTKPDNQK